MLQKYIRDGVETSKQLGKLRSTVRFSEELPNNDAAMSTHYRMRSLHISQSSCNANFDEMFRSGLVPQRLVCIVNMFGT